MNLKNMEYFLTVCASETITSASEILYVSQQALSQTIKKIEQEFGEKLFVRTNPIELTKAGNLVKTSFENILKEYSMLASSLKQEDCLMIGYFDSQQQNIKMTVERMKKQFPEQNMLFKELKGNFIPENIDVILTNRQMNEAYQLFGTLNNQCKVWVKNGLENHADLALMLKRFKESKE